MMANHSNISIASLALLAWPLLLLSIVAVVGDDPKPAPPGPSPSPSPSPAPAPGPAPAPPTGQVFECKTDYATVKGNQGILRVTRNQPSCGFSADDGVNFFAIDTTNLRMTSKDSITLEPRNSADSPRTITGNIEAGFLLSGMEQPRITFKFDHLDNSVMELPFVQKDPNVPIDGNRPNQLVIRAFEASQYNLVLAKTIEQPVHVQILGSSDSFGHYLFDKNSTTIPIKNDKATPPNKVEQRIVVNSVPVSSECSKTFQDSAETTHDLVGPDVSKLRQPYTCVNIFNLAMADPAHYDIDFANFLDIVDKDDELTVSDGLQSLKVVKFTAKSYYQEKPVVSFRGQKLVVVYESPQVVNPLVTFKLAVKSKAYGGVLDKYGPLTIPAKGTQARYSLRPPNNDAKTSLVIKGNKLPGVNLKISDDQNRVIMFNDKMFLPPKIAFQDTSAEINVELDAFSATGGSIEYKQDTACSGTLFEASGTISIKGSNMTCYWLLGASKSTLSINYNDLAQPDGCLEIYSLIQEKPLFSRCNISPTEMLPPFVVGASYLKVTTSKSSISSFEASVSQPLVSLVRSASTSTSTLTTQTNISSTGYPTSYSWSDTSDTFLMGPKSNKTKMVISVADLDLRSGEKLMVGAIEVKSSPRDIDILSSPTNVTIQRSSGTKDFALHRGFSIVATEFQSVVMALAKDVSVQQTVVSPKNASSLLLKISAKAKTRISYNIAFSKADQDNQIRVIDSQSLVGRQVLKEEQFHGSTTTNTLIVTYFTTKPNTTLPELTVSYNQTACNQTSDIICDNGTRCIPPEKMCKGHSYCLDGTDLKWPCSSGPAPPPKIVQNGVTGLTVFILSVLMFSFGCLAALYGPDLYKSLETRFRSGQYTTFSSTE